MTINSRSALGPSPPRWEDRLSLWLDGRAVAQIEAPVGASRFALFTDGAAAAFRDVSFTGLA